MVPSPRKRAPSTFDQTWNRTDAAFLDPNALPVARIPRGWERRPETKKTEEGKSKKIWRRFDLRSRASDAVEAEDDQDHDARSRPVKKLQQMSPSAMEKSSTRRTGKNRAFKATRWDRRKSVLPRKNVAPSEHDSTNMREVDGDHNEEDITHEELSENGITELREDSGISVGPDQGLIPEDENRRGTFTFAMETDVDELANESLDVAIDVDDGRCDNTSLVDDVTITRLFRSPIKQPFQFRSASPEKVEYPELPHSEGEEMDDGPEEEAKVVEENEAVGLIEGEAVESTVHSAQAQEQFLHCEINHSSEASSDEVVTPSTRAVPDSTIETTNISTSSSGSSLTSNDINYPELPTNIQPNDTTANQAELLMEDIATPSEDVEMSNDVEIEEEFTEASLQLSILRECEAAALQEQPTLLETDGQDTTPATPGVSEEMRKEAAPLRKLRDTPLLKRPNVSHADDITAGLTLSFTPAKTTTAEPTPKKLHSPPPPAVQSGADDATMTIALDDDTALLKDFLNRAAASKAEKAAILTHRRESLQNRRDSDVVRHALASPRKVLEDKDPNSPSKHDAEVTLDLSQTLTLHEDKAATLDQAETEETEASGEARSGRVSRRSSRTKKSRLPAPAATTQGQAQTSKIAIRRTDGSEHVVLKKSDAQELATLTRANTRKNKQGAFGVTVRLLKIAFDSANLPPIDDTTKEVIVGKNVRWDEQLAYYQENPETLAEAESLATPDELGMPDEPSKKTKAKVSKNSTPKIRRVRGLGTANGTPAKGLLAPASLLPDEVQEEKEATPAAAPTKQPPRPKTSKTKKMPVASNVEPTPSTTTTTTTASTFTMESKLPTLEIAPVGVEQPPREQRKSRLAAPKKVMLPPPTSAAMSAEGKENTMAQQHQQRTGLGAATPKKGIPAPKVNVPSTVGVESGLPRRRARRV